MSGLDLYGEMGCSCEGCESVLRAEDQQARDRAVAVAAPWERGDDSQDRFNHVWYRLDGDRGDSPMSTRRALAEVWPAGHVGYRWTVCLRGGEGDDFASGHCGHFESDAENLARAKHDADAVLRARGALSALGPSAAGALPDVRDLPLEDRRAVFLDGLRALTQMTGVVAVVHDDSDGADEYTGDVTLRDIAEVGAGQYHLAGDGWCAWWRNEDEPNRAAYERNLKVNAIRKNLAEMRAVLAVREQHKVTRGVDGLRADIAAAEAELRALGAE